MQTKGTFSIGWFITTVIIHIVGTGGLGLLAFVAGMSAFTYGDGREGHPWLWLWTPPALAFHLANIDGGSPFAGHCIIPAALSWSVIVGIGGGYFFGWLFGGRDQSSPEDCLDRNKETMAGKEDLPARKGS